MVLWVQGGLVDGESSSVGFRSGVKWVCAGDSVDSVGSSERACI